MNKDSIGDTLKAVEQLEAGRKADPFKPLMARLDGRSFHTFTRGLARPYDIRMSQLMFDTTKFLIEQTHAKLGYTQSDEISLYWNNTPENIDSTYMFDGKYQKLCSVLSGLASAFFSKYLASYIEEKANEIAVFDCRVWNVDTIQDVHANFLWRQGDAIKNSISMAAQAHFSHTALQGVGSEAKKKMLREAGNPWELQPGFFRHGTFLKRSTKMVDLTMEQALKIPEKFRPTGPVERSVVETVDYGYISKEMHLFS